MPQQTHHAHDGPHKDRWHYLDYRDGKHDANYVEWKYFNFIQDGLAGYMSYYILDPEKGSGLSGARLLLRVFKDGKLLGNIKHIDIDRVQFDPVSASATFDKAAIVERDAHHYDISADFDDIAWQLSYKQEVPTIDSFSDVDQGLLSWERLAWLIKMPRAKVVGTVRIGIDTFNINASGYTDTNWGEIAQLSSQYEWGQFSDGNLSLVFAVLFGLKKIKNTYFYFAIGKHVVSLADAQCSIVHAVWAHDKETGIKIPSQTTFTVKKNDYLLTFNTNLLQADTPGIQIRKFLPKIVISEQLVRYDGKIEKDGALLYEFHGNGFEEWSTKTWRKIAVPF